MRIEWSDTYQVGDPEIDEQPPRVTILVACIDPRTLGSAMKEIRGTLRTDIQGQSGSSVVAA